MGREKALIEVGGVRLLDRVAAAAVDAGASRIAVVSSRGTIDGFETVPDIYRGKGALGGIHSALKHAGSDDVLICGCDLPFVSSEFFTLLIGAYKNGDDGGVVPEQPDGVLQPLAAIYSRSRCLPECEAILSDTEASYAVSALLDKVTPHVVPFSEYSHLANANRLLVNLNTPEDLERARNLSGGSD